MKLDLKLWMTHVMKTGLFMEKTFANLQKLGVTYMKFVANLWPMALISVAPLPNMSLTKAKNRLFCENPRLEYCASAERIAGLWIHRDEEERSGINLSLDVIDDSFVPTVKFP